jgi:hypothetical protein
MLPSWFDVVDHYPSQNQEQTTDALTRLADVLESSPRTTEDSYVDMRKVEVGLEEWNSPKERTRIRPNQATSKTP